MSGFLTHSSNVGSLPKALCFQMVFYETNTINKTLPLKIKKNDTPRCGENSGKQTWHKNKQNKKKLKLYKQRKLNTKVGSLCLSLPRRVFSLSQMVIIQKKQKKQTQTKVGSVHVYVYCCQGDFIHSGLNCLFTTTKKKHSKMWQK